MKYVYDVCVSITLKQIINVLMCSSVQILDIFKTYSLSHYNVYVLLLWFPLPVSGI